MKNLHVPLPEEVHATLREESARSNRPATTLAREAIETWLRQREQDRLHSEILDFALTHGGSDLDLDPQLESASLEHLHGLRPGKKR